MPEAISALQMGQTSVSKNAKSLGKFAEHHGNVVTIKGLELIAVAPDLRERRRLCMTLTPKGRRVLATLLERLALPEREPERGDDERISEG
jgi:DNA-binding MarR family transcriptional regulator